MLLQDSADKSEHALASEREVRQTKTQSQSMRTLQLQLKDQGGATMRLRFEAWALLVKTRRRRFNSTIPR